MSVKTLIFGQNSRIKQLVQCIDAGRPSQDSDDTIRVQNITVNEKSFLLFAISDRGLISQQAVGSNALVFFIDHDKQLYEQRQFLINTLRSRQQFNSIPLVVLFEKNHGLTIKEVINFFELYKMKDRTSMIKQINFVQKSTVLDVFLWIEAQQQSMMNRSRTSFDAHPKVIKMKAKYRDSDQDESVRKYEGILNDKEIRNRQVKDQQTTYIQQEKDRIKNQNMEKQLSNFNKNKKKMTPYDIKATPNAKIDANLHFFLKDPKSLKAPQVNIKIQTDQFKPRPPEKAYVPKKTGINISTQIQVNELFDFNKEVKPILNILTIKALQNAALEIQEEEQFARIQKYKSAYNDRVRKQKDHEKKKIEDEMALIKKKEALLEQTRKKHADKKNIKKRIICYDLSSRFLQGIYKRANLKVYKKNQYYDPYENPIQTEYLEHLVQKTASQLRNLEQKGQLIKGVFDKDCVEPILKLSQQPKQLRQAKKLQASKRRINQSKDKRVLHILYKHDQQKYSNFSKYISKNFDNTLEQFIRVKEEQYQEISDKISTGDLPQQALAKKRNQQNAEFGNTHFSFAVDSEKQIGFSITPNRYEKNSSQNLMSMGFIGLDSEGEVTIQDCLNGGNGSTLQGSYEFISKVTNLRSAHKIVNMDDAMVIDLKKINPKVNSLILYTKFNNVTKYSDQQQNKKVKYASYGLEFYQKGIPIHKENIAEKINWAEIIKAPENQQQQDSPEEKSQTLINVAYLLTRKPEEHWNIQHVRYVHNTPLNQKDNSAKEQFFEELVKFHVKSRQILRDEQQQAALQAQLERKTASKKEKRGRSSKKIVQAPPPVEKPTFKITSKILSELQIDLNRSLEDNTAVLSDTLKEWKQFIEYCGQPGWELLFRGKRLQSVDQLKKFNKIGDLVVIKLQPVIQEEEKKEQNQQGQDDQENENQ